MTKNFIRLASVVALITIIFCLVCNNTSENMVDGNNVVTYPSGEDIKFSVMSFNLFLGGVTKGAPLVTPLC